MRKILLLLFVTFFGISYSKAAATFTSVQSGSFGATSTWNVVGFDIDGLPDLNDDVFISTGHTVTLNTSSNARSITINPGGVFNMNSFVMLVWGNLTNNGSSVGSGTWQFHAVGTYSGNPINNSGTIYFYTNYTIAAGVVLNKTGGINVSSGATVNNGGNITLVSGGILNVFSNAMWKNNANSSLNVSSNVINSGTIDCSTNPNTFTYSTAGYNTVMCTNATYYNLVLTAPVSSTKTLNGTLNVLNDLTLSIRVTLGWANNNINLGGDWINNAGTNGTGMGTITFNGAAGTQLITRPASTERFQHMIVATGGTVQMAQALRIQGNLTLTSGTLDVSASNFDLTLFGNFTNNATFNGRAGTVFLTGNFGQTMAASSVTAFNNLTSTDFTGINVTTGTFTLTGILTVTQGAFGVFTPATFTIRAPAPTIAGRIAPLGATASLTGTGWVVKCYINGPAARNWQYLGSPMSGNTIADWDNDQRFYMSGVGGNDGNACCPTFFSVRTFNSATNAWVNVTTTGTNLTACQGFSVWMADNNTSGLTAPLIFDSRGTPNFGNKSTPLTANRYSCVSNPYACPVDFATVVAASTNANASFMCWQESGSYVTNPNGGVIASTQGFMAFGNAAGTLQFTEACKNTVANPNVIRTADPENYLRIRTSNDVNGLGGEAVVRIDNNAVNGYDQMDLPFLASMFDDATNVWTTDEAGSEQLLNAVDGSRENLDIPLTLMAGTVGNQMVSFTGLSHFTEYSCATLEDLTTGEIVNLKQKDNYTYFADQLGDKRVLMLHLSRNGECPLSEQNLVSSLDAQTLVFVSNNQLMAHFNFEENTAVEVSIFDVDGRQIADAQNMTVANESVVLPSPKAHGIYFVRITAGDKVCTKKIYF